MNGYHVSRPTDIRILDRTALSQPAASGLGWLAASVSMRTCLSLRGCFARQMQPHHHVECLSFRGRSGSSTSFPGHSLAEELWFWGRLPRAPPLKGATRTNPIVASICSSCPLPGPSCGVQVGRFSGKWDKLARDACLIELFGFGEVRPHSSLGALKPATNQMNDRAATQALWNQR